MKKILVNKESQTMLLQLKDNEVEVIVQYLDEYGDPDNKIKLYIPKEALIDLLEVPTTQGE